MAGVQGCQMSLKKHSKVKESLSTAKNFFEGGDNNARNADLANFSKALTFGGTWNKPFLS